LAFDLVADRAFDAAEGIQVLEFDAITEGNRAARADRDVHVAAERPLFHVAFGDVERPQRQPKFVQVGPSVLRRAKVGSTHDFEERDAASIQVDERRTAAFFVVSFARVLFEMGADEPDRLAVSEERRGDGSAGHDRTFVLRDLVALRQIRVEILLAIEARHFGDRTADRESEADREFGRLAIRGRATRPEVRGTRGT
jgi:hypothetical protein